MAADKLFGALSLAKRAGALTVGFDAVCEAAAKGQAALVLLANDTSPGTQKRVQKACQNCNVQTLPYSQQELSAISRKPAGVLAVTNNDLAGLCLQNLVQGGHKEEPV